MSENIWDTLRMTLSLNGRHDLLKLEEKRDLKQINNELNNGNNSGSVEAL